LASKVEFVFLGNRGGIIIFATTLVSRSGNTECFFSFDNNKVFVDYVGSCVRAERTLFGHRLASKEQKNNGK
jgi:hypothetical protein